MKMQAEITADMDIDQAIKAQEEKSKERDAKEFAGEENEVIEGYTIDLHLIKQAWGRYRPVQEIDTDPDRKKKASVVRDLKNIFTEPFIDKLMANINLKIYKFEDTEDQCNRKKNFKEYFKKHYKAKHAANNPKPDDEDEKQEDEDDKYLEDLPATEEEWIDAFLERFTMPSDKANKRG